MVRLRLHIDGAKGEVSFDSFLSLMNNARLALDDIDRAISVRGRTVSWRVADLGTNSLDAVLVGQVRRAKTEREAQMVSANFVNGMRMLGRGEELPAYFSLKAVEHIRRLAMSLEKNGAKGFSAEYMDEGLKSYVSAETNARIKLLTAAKYKAIGSVIGRLELVSLHGKRNKFETYDELTKRAVRSTFPDVRLEEVRGALGRRVIVSGVVWRNNKGQPLRVDQARIATVPVEGDLPLTEEIFGLDPDFTGQFSTEDYIRRLRDA